MPNRPGVFIMKLADIRALFPNNMPPEESLLLAAHFLNTNKAALLAMDDVRISDDQKKAIQDSSVRITNGVPLPYILGEWHFYGHTFIINEHVLIPRPETELVIDLAKEWAAKGSHKAPTFIDVGCGSGIIGITLALDYPLCRSILIDISKEALSVAQTNAKRLAVSDRVDLWNNDLLDGLNIRINPNTVLIANLPYIPTQTLLGLDVYKKEPTLALDGGIDGLQIISRLMAQISARRDKPSLILLEMEATQGAALTAICQQAIPNSRVEVIRDLAGLDRVVRVELG